MILATRHSIKQDLLAYGELELANRVDQATEEDLNEIGRLAGKHIGEGGYIALHVALGAIEFFEKAPREPKRTRRDLSVYQVPEQEPKENVFLRLFGRKK